MVAWVAKQAQNAYGYTLRWPEIRERAFRVSGPIWVPCSARWPPRPVLLHWVLNRPHTYSPSLSREPRANRPKKRFTMNLFDGAVSTSSPRLPTWPIQRAPSRDTTTQFLDYPHMTIGAKGLNRSSPVVQLTRPTHTHSHTRKTPGKNFVPGYN